MQLTFVDWLIIGLYFAFNAEDHAVSTDFASLTN